MTSKPSLHTRKFPESAGGGHCIGRDLAMMQQNPQNHMIPVRAQAYLMKITEGSFHMKIQSKPKTESGLLRSRTRHPSGCCASGIFIG